MSAPGDPILTVEHLSMRFGGLVAIAHADGFLNKLIIVIAITFGTINIVGGFLVTDRMLEMFKGKKPDPKEPPGES